MIEFLDGEISVVTLNNPERHNALSHEDFAELDVILGEIEASDARAVILTGAGQSFCAGVEFASLQVGDWAHNNPLNALCERVSRLPMPVIAALNGHFVGGGAELAFSCDFRISVPEARCRIPAAGIAVHYEPTGIGRVASVVGLQMARRLFIGFESFEGDDLLKYGFVDEMSEDFMATSQSYAKRVSELAPQALRGMKLSLNSLRDGGEDDARDRIVAAFSSADFEEAMRAVKERRKPKFTG